MLNMKYCFLWPGAIFLFCFLGVCSSVSIIIFYFLELCNPSLSGRAGRLRAALNSSDNCNAFLAVEIVSLLKVRHFFSLHLPSLNILKKTPDKMETSVHSVLQLPCCLIGAARRAACCRQCCGSFLLLLACCPISR